MPKKRGQNEGTIFLESDGRWVASLTLGYRIVDGKRRRIRKKFVASTRAAVQRRLTEALRAQQTGGIVPLQRDSVGGYLERFPAMLRAKGRSESTVASYEWIIKKYITPELGNVPLIKLTQVHVNDMMQRKLDAGLSPRTVQYCHAVIRSALARAEKDGMVSRNVAKLATAPGNAKGSIIEPLTPEEARRLLATVQGHRLEALYSVALALGLRRGEAMGLEWPAVDLERGTIAVTQTLKRVKGKGILIERAAKTHKSLRMLPLPAFAIRVLRSHHAAQQKERAFAGDQWKDFGLVFPTSRGTPIEPRNLVRHFHAALKRVGIDRRRFHDLRHTAASLLIAQGATLHEVKEILGHSQIRLTADLYGHAYMDAKREIVSRMDGVLSPEPNPVAPSLAPSLLSKAVN